MNQLQVLIDEAALDARVDDFDLAWATASSQKAKNTPGLANSIDVLRLEDDLFERCVLVHLIAIDLERRWQARSRSEGGSHEDFDVETERYLAQFPILNQSPLLKTFIVCAEHRARLRHDGNRRFELLRRFADVEQLSAKLVAIEGEFAAEPDFFVPPKLPGFEFESELGRGGSGTVYKAWQPELGRHVAIKMLHHQSVGEDVRTRFRIEGQTLASLQHPGIVSIYAFEEYQEQMFIVMELVQGESLAASTQGEMSFAAIAQVIRDISSALEYAHQAGILHRDLKPANVMIDGQGAIRLMDFGLAKRYAHGTNAAASLTHSRSIVGTPCFMAPEQIDGEGGVLSPATDVYAIGATMYALLVGRPPFRGSSTWETFQLILAAEYVSPRQHNQKIPRDLETICERCLSRDPRNRYQSSQEVADELERFANRQPIVARPQGTLEKWLQFAKRSPREAALWSGLFTVLVALFAVFLFSSLSYHALYVSEQQQRREAESHLELSELGKYSSLVNQAHLQYESNRLSLMENALNASKPTNNSADRRDFEWYYLQNLANSGQSRFAVEIGDAVQISAIDTSSDNALIACGTSVPWYETMIQENAARARIWNQQSLEIELDAVANGNVVGSVALSPNNNYFAFVSHMVQRADEEAYLTPYSELNVYSKESGNQWNRIWTTRDLDPNFVRVAFSVQEDRLFTLSNESLIAWDVPSGEPVWEVADATGFRLGDQAMTIRKSGSPQADVVRISDGAPAKSVTDDSLGQFTYVRDMHAFINDQAQRKLPTFATDATGTLETRYLNRRLVVINRESKETLCELAKPQLCRCKFHPKEAQIALGLPSGMVEIWDLELSKSLGKFQGHTSSIESLHYSANGRFLFSGDQSGRIIKWDLKFGSGSVVVGEMAQKIGDTERAFSAFAYASETIVGVNAGEEVCSTWNIHSGMLVDQFSIDSRIPQLAPGRGAAISADSTKLAFVDFEHRSILHLWNTTTQRKVNSVNHEAPVQFVHAGEHGKLVACAAWNRKGEGAISDALVAVYDARSGARIWSRMFSAVRIWRLVLDEQRGFLCAVLTHPRSPTSSIVDNAKTEVVCWNLKADREIWTYSLPDDTVLSLGLDLSTRLSAIAIGTLQEKITLLSLKDGTEILSFEGMENLEDLTFSPNGRRLAATNRKLLAVWETTSGQRVLSLSKPITSFDPIHNPQILFTNDGNRLMVNRFDGTIQTFDGDVQRGLR